MAVREGNTVLGIDACDYFNNPGSHPTPYMLQYSATREFGAAIYRSPNGKLFAVSNYRPQGKVMFSEASVSHSVHSGEKGLGRPPSRQMPAPLDKPPSTDI